jgi:hypothetical protein
MWRPEQHPDDINLRWAWLRAVEWRDWPLFISQPVVPVLLYFYPWTLVVGFLVALTFMWWLIIAPRITPVTGIDIAVYFVWLRFLTSPLMAYLIWQKGGQWTAALALLWPFLGTWMVGILLLIPQEFLSIIFPGLKSAQVGIVQQRLMDNLGYDRVEGIGYMRREEGR